MKKKNKTPIIIVIVLLIIIGIGVEYYFLFAPKPGETTSETFNDKLEQVIEKRDAEKFLRMFARDQTKSPLSKLGAQSIFKNWSNHGSSGMSIGNEIMNHGLAEGDPEYSLSYVTHDKLHFFSKVYLKTKTSKLIVDKRLKNANFKVNDVKFSYADLTQNQLFPGDYKFEINYKGHQYSQNVVAFGTGNTVYLEVQTGEVAQAPKAIVDSYNNDPSYVEPLDTQDSDIDGTWVLVESERDLNKAMLPDTISFKDDVIEKWMHDGSHITSHYTDVFYRGGDLQFISGPASPAFQGKIVKKVFYGSQRVALEEVRQGSYGWYLRE